MESDKGVNEQGLYDNLRKRAIRCIEFKQYEMAQKILSRMIENWPERVIARGELASNVNISNFKLNTPVAIP